MKERTTKDAGTMSPFSAAAEFLLVASLLICPLACKSGNSSPKEIDGGAGGTDTPEAGGSPGSGGLIGSGGLGAGGASGSGGVLGTGGLGAGGASGSGGTPGSGGKSGLGGSASGGTVGFGGTPDLGGTASGGSVASGGKVASGGTAASGGKVASGGTAASGGKVASGGTAASGGKVASGGVATGGTPSMSGTAGTGGTAGAGGIPGSGGTVGAAGEYGFTYRSPESHTVSCTGSLGTLTLNTSDKDWLCTFNQASTKGYVYVRSTVNGAQCVAGGIMPMYTTDVAQISIDGGLTPLANAQYSFGGPHNNDYLSFDYQGVTFRYYHSSLGYGGRKCQPMDCINIYVLGSTTLQTEGCTPARTLPEVCVPIKAGGIHDPLVETFAKCPGDPNA